MEGIGRILMTGLLVIPLSCSGTLTAWAEVSFEGNVVLGEAVLKAGGAGQAFEKKTGVRFILVGAGGTGKAIQAMKDGTVNVAGWGRALNAEERKLGWLGTTVAYDGLAIFLNEQNPLRNLTKAQLKDIFSGKVGNWKEVGGPDLPILVVSEPLASQRATTKLFQELILDNGPFLTGFKEIDQQADLIPEVGRNPGGVCFVSVGFIPSGGGSGLGAKGVSLNRVEPSSANIRSGSYLLSRPIQLVTKGLPKGDPKKFIDFMLSSEGQALIGKALIPVKNK